MKKKVSNETFYGLKFICKFKWRQNYNHKSFILFLPPSRHDLTIITVILWFHFHSLWQIFWTKSLANSNAINEEREGEGRALIKKWLIHLQLSSHRVFNLATSGSTNIKKKVCLSLFSRVLCVPFKKYSAQVWRKRRGHEDINFLQDYPSIKTHSSLSYDVE